MMRTYSELRDLRTFEERFDYLELTGSIGIETFGFDRIFNQKFYNSYEWRHVRDKVILRDNGCDLGVPGYEINGRIMIHHINPITLQDIERKTDYLLDPEYLICVSHKTHNAIHFGDRSYLETLAPIERTLNDTCPWRK